MRAGRQKSVPSPTNSSFSVNTTSLPSLYPFPMFIVPSLAIAFTVSMFKIQLFIVHSTLMQLLLIQLQPSLWIAKKCWCMHSVRGWCFLGAVLCNTYFTFRAAATVVLTTNWVIEIASWCTLSTETTANEWSKGNSTMVLLIVQIMNHSIKYICNTSDKQLQYRNTKR